MGQRTKQTFLQMANKHKKRCSTSLILEKCKSKPKLGTISHQSERMLSKSLQAVNAVEGVGKGNPLTLLVGMETSTATMEKSMEIP